MFSPWYPDKTNNNLSVGSPWQGCSWRYQAREHPSRRVPQGSSVGLRDLARRRERGGCRAPSGQRQGDVGIRDGRGRRPARNLRVRSEHRAERRRGVCVDVHVDVCDCFLLCLLCWGNLCPSLYPSLSLYVLVAVYANIVLSFCIVYMFHVMFCFSASMYLLCVFVCTFFVCKYVLCVCMNALFFMSCFS